MQVSVIIPVYNAEKYVREAVESALIQPETGEVILVEDNSLDNSIQVCQELEKEYSNVKLFQHFNRKNLGAGASRNLGIIKAQYDYISFLDADDYYLPQHFQTSKRILENSPYLDGVYEGMGIYFQDNVTKEHWKKRWFPKQDFRLTMTNKKIPPRLLFEYLLTKNIGLIHANTITVRKNLFKRTGGFDEDLKLRQDTAMWLKMAMVGNLVSGNLNKFVSMRRVHKGNRISNSLYEFNYFGYLMWDKLFEWSIKNSIKTVKKGLLVSRYSKIKSSKFFKLRYPLSRWKKAQILLMYSY